MVKTNSIIKHGELPSGELPVIQDWFDSQVPTGIGFYKTYPDEKILKNIS